MIVKEIASCRALRGTEIFVGTQMTQITQIAAEGRPSGLQFHNIFFADFTGHSDFWDSAGLCGLGVGKMGQCPLFYSISWDRVLSFPQPKNLERLSKNVLKSFKRFFSISCTCLSSTSQ